MWLDFVNELRRHPIVIALFSSGLLAILVSRLGARLQHENWKKQEEIARKKVAQEKLFDKRAEIIRRVFYLMKKREQLIWNSYHAIKRQRESIKKGGKEFTVLFAEEAREYRDLEQEVVSESNGLLEEMKIFFGVAEEVEESAILKDFVEISKIWHRVSYRITREQLEEEYINEETRKVDQHRLSIQKRLRELVYQTQPERAGGRARGSTEVNASTPDNFDMSISGTSPDDVQFGTNLAGVTIPGSLTVERPKK